MEETEKQTKSSVGVVIWSIVFIALLIVSRFIITGGNINIYIFIGECIGSFVLIFLFSIWLLNIANRDYTKNMKRIRIMIVVTIMSILFSLQIKESVTYYSNNQTTVTETQKEQMDEYTFKYFSLLSPIQITEKEIQKDNRYDYLKQYLAQSEELSVFIEEDKLKDDKASSRNSLYNFISFISGQGEAEKSIDKMVKTKIGDINQTSCDYEKGLWKYKIVAFAKDDKNVIVAICFDKTQKKLEETANKIATSIKLTM